jgi:hypothetical protein
MITKFKLFEYDDIRSEFPDMFEPKKPEDEPQVVPGFENGTIDPEDDELWGNNKKTEKELYKELFLPLVRERNFNETDDEITINITKLWEDFMMSIYSSQKHFRIFLNNELIGKYVSKGFKNILTDEKYEGIIENIGYLINGDNCFVDFRLKNKKVKNGFCENYITIDKLKSEANKYNL